MLFWWCTVSSEYGPAWLHVWAPADSHECVHAMSLQRGLPLSSSAGSPRCWADHGWMRAVCHSVHGASQLTKTCSPGSPPHLTLAHNAGAAGGGNPAKAAECQPQVNPPAGLLLVQPVSLPLVPTSQGMPGGRKGVLWRSIQVAAGGLAVLVGGILTMLGAPGTLGARQSLLRRWHMSGCGGPPLL